MEGEVGVEDQVAVDVPWWMCFNYLLSLKKFEEYL